MTVVFSVRRREPELVGPARPTPRETKRLSDLDDKEGLRCHVPNLFFYRRVVHGDHPARSIRRALGEALVPYYPLAGRLREVEGRKLVVDCTGEGVLFVEADADAPLAELEAAGLRPPFPSMDQLLFDVEGSGGIINTPLLLIQVTRLLCGGFVLAVRLNHVMCDAPGIVQFLSAVAELARGLPSPTISPSWSRELLNARSPPEPTFPHHEYDPVPPSRPPPSPSDMVMRTFTFTAADVTMLKNKHLSPHLRDTATTFDVLAACLWIARTAALEISPEEDARLTFPATIRGVRELGLPAGYYGNAFVLPMAVAAAGSLRGGGGLGYAVELVREAKKAAASADGRPSPAMGNMFMVSDNRRAGFDRLDFGWGKPVYGGVASPTSVLSYLIAVRNGDGEDAIAVPVMLPQPAMDRFASELKESSQCLTS
ncbi:hypothetical protein HU200_015993 [Digitaria exilis]|uniref:Uncharacterized protein n=1 Tax=Digitaria exilis TaxID=1010633 RepID=A0A835F8P7_9POAL|nr:hypothetical protein HU200_015993 [Digitaria exilis]